MPKVILLTGRYCDINGAQKPGDTIEVSDAEAKAMIEANQAKRATASRSKKEPTKKKTTKKKA